MKKTILATILGIFCFAGAANAQYRPTFILQGGYQGSNLSNMEDSKVKSGFRVGLAADFVMFGSDVMELSLQPGVNFASKGFETSVDNVNMTLNYIDVPILLNMRFGVSDTFGAFVNVGPYLGFGINGEAKLGGLSINNVFKSDDDGIIGSALKANRFDAGLQVGAGLEFSRFLIGAGYQMGLTNVFGDNDKKAVEANLEDSSKGNRNNSFFVSVGYRF